MEFADKLICELLVQVSVPPAAVISGLELSLVTLTVVVELHPLILSVITSWYVPSTVMF